MNQEELIEEIYKRNEYSRKSLNIIVKCLFEVIRDAISKGESVVILGHTSWLVSELAERVYIDPRGKEKALPRRPSIRVRAGADLKLAVGMWKTTKNRKKAQKLRRKKWLDSQKQQG